MRSRFVEVPEIFALVVATAVIAGAQSIPPGSVLPAASARQAPLAASSGIVSPLRRVGFPVLIAPMQHIRMH